MLDEFGQDLGLYFCPYCMRDLEIGLDGTVKHNKDDYHPEEWEG